MMGHVVACSLMSNLDTWYPIDHKLFANKLPDPMAHLGISWAGHFIARICCRKDVLFLAGPSQVPEPELYGIDSYMHCWQQ